MHQAIERLIICPQVYMREILFKSEIKPLEWKLFYQWILATTIAWTITSLALVYTDISTLWLLPIIGLAQWYVLEYYLPNIRWWIWTNLLGVFISGVILTTLVIGGVNLNILAHPVFSGTLTGVLVGILQWFFLRRRVSKASWWILANVVGVSLAKTIGLAVRLLLGSLLGTVSGGLVFGSVTGFLLIWLLQSPVPEEPL